MKKKITVSELPNWPPDTGGPSSRGQVFAAGIDQVLVKDVKPVEGKVISFTATLPSSEQELLYWWTAPDKRVAEIVAQILRRHVGSSLASVGLAIVPDEESIPERDAT